MAFCLLFERKDSSMNELEQILKQFAASGWELIAAPSAAWLRGEKDLPALKSSLEKAEHLCGSCGCGLDPLYPKALLLLESLS